MSKLTVGASFAAGASAAYYLDPERGRARRAKAKDKGLSAIRSLGDRTSARAKYQRNVMEGWVHETKSALRAPRKFDDNTLVQKVRSEVLGNWTSQGNPPVHVVASRGQVTLTTVLSDPGKQEDLVERVRHVEGVRDVEVRDGLAASDG